MRTSLILNIYLALSVLYLGVVLVEPSLTFYIKPLLVLSLIVAVYSDEPFSYKGLLLAALFFSWLGDVVLMFQGAGYFIGGLVAFLCSHILYIGLFWTIRQQAGVLGKRALLLIGIIVLTYLANILALLMPHLGDMQAPVVIYALTICTMGTMASIGFLNWPSPARYWILLGAIAFVISDSILAINKFYAPVPLSSLGIMSTYLIAQYSIVRGVLILQKSR